MATWALRTTTPELRARYLAFRYWTDDTLATLVLDGLARCSHLEYRVWSRSRPSRHTIGDVARMARRFAGALAARGIRERDVVVFQLPNSVEAGVVFYAAALLGVVLVPVVHFYGTKELGHILRQSDAKVFVTADRFGHLDYLAGLERLAPELVDVELVVVAGDAPSGTVAFDALVDEDRDVTPVAPDPDAPAVVGFTSGTTADPKGVIHTHRTLTAEMRQITDMGGLRPRPMLVGAPVGHAIGMQAGLLSPLIRGLSIHLMDVWNPADVLHAMEEADLTAGSGSTYFLTSLLDAPECTTRHHALIGSVGMGGSAIPAAVAERAESLGIGLVRSYGSTEHPSTTGSRPEDPREQRLYTDGVAMPGVDVRLVDERGRDVSPGEAGEIWSRGPDLFMGYTDPTLTKEAFHDGWYASGDIAVRNDRGWITITDRKKDIIIRGGENISAAEVEELLSQIPGVSEVAVVAAPDERLGEHACAFVRLQPGAAPPDLDAVRAHLERAGLARQKWPEELRIEDEFPRTSSGKTQKYVLRERLRAEADARRTTERASGVSGRSA